MSTRSSRTKRWMRWKQFSTWGCMVLDPSEQRLRRLLQQLDTEEGRQALRQVARRLHDLERRLEQAKDDETAQLNILQDGVLRKALTEVINLTGDVDVKVDPFTKIVTIDVGAGAGGGKGFGAPTGQIDIDDTNAEGGATTATRADHQHAFPAPAPN